MKVMNIPTLDILYTPGIVVIRARPYCSLRELTRETEFFMLAGQRAVFSFGGGGAPLTCELHSERKFGEAWEIGQLLGGN